MLSWRKGEALSMRRSQDFYLELGDLRRDDVKDVFGSHLSEALVGLVEHLVMRGELKSLFLIRVELEQDNLDYRWVVKAFTKSAIEWKISPLRWLAGVWGRLRYRLGLTHQFRCPECGAPQSEKWRDRWAGGWEWCCEFCGWGNVCLHKPQILKPQHRRVLAVRKAIWRLRRRLICST